jgi:hypothetical protein
MMEDLYIQVAQSFAKRINEVFTSEATLAQEFEKRFPGLTFSRTDHWMGILFSMMRDCWLQHVEVKGEVSSYDRDQILRALHPLLDFNLFTQVLLNLQSYATMAYRTGDAAAQLELLKNKWEQRKVASLSRTKRR